MTRVRKGGEEHWSHLGLSLSLSLSLTLSLSLVALSHSVSLSNSLSLSHLDLPLSPPPRLSLSLSHCRSGYAHEQRCGASATVQKNTTTVHTNNCSLPLFGTNIGSNTPYFGQLARSRWSTVDLYYRSTSFYTHF